MNKSYWMWHYGDYEVYHIAKVNSRREERGYMRPAMWKIFSPFISVKFRKTFTAAASGDLCCHINGEGHIDLDGTRYYADTRIAFTAGFHCVEILVSKWDGLPAAYVESDVCPSDGSWLCNHFAGAFFPVGWDEHFTRVDQNPEVFPFSYQTLLPTATERINGGILCDFGREVFGYLDVHSISAADTVGVFYGESREEALDTAYSYLTDSLHGKTDYRLRQRGFRYVFLSGIHDIPKVTAEYEYLPLTRKGNFTCSNETFNRIVEVAGNTFHLNCREAFLDGIKRDRWVWSGDAYQSARINRYLFADPAIEQRTWIGLIGKEPIEQHINTILDYSLLWLIGLCEHYMTYGDMTFLERIHPMAEKMLTFCETRLNADGFLEGFPEDWVFVDWAQMDKSGAVCAEQLLLAQAYHAMSVLTRALGNEADAAELSAKKENLLDRINEFYWDTEKGAFIDSYRSGNTHITRHANIFAVLYDLVTEEQAQSILKNVLKNEQVSPITTPYFEGYELEALAKLGAFREVEETLSSYWGGMLTLGAETVWEEYHPDQKGIEHYEMYGGKYEKSLCHAWGAGPIYLFGRYYLGVYATAPGYETFRVEPHTGGLKSFSGTVPLGEAQVTIEYSSEKLCVLATKPGGTLLWAGKEYSILPNEPLCIPV